MKDVIIYGTPVCPNCKDVMRYLDSAGLSYQYKTVGEDITQADLSSIVGRPVRSVPVITVDGSDTSYDDLRNKVALSEVSDSLEGLEL